jgi:ABC-type transport system substrate-binding protein
MRRTHSPFWWHHLPGGTGRDAATETPSYHSAGNATTYQNLTDVITIATNRAPSNLDPHSAYDAGTGVTLQGPFESLIRLKPRSANKLAPLLAETWSSNADKSMWSFTLRPDLPSTMARRAMPKLNGVL